MAQRQKKMFWSCLFSYIDGHNLRLAACSADKTKTSRSLSSPSFSQVSPCICSARLNSTLFLFLFFFGTRLSHSAAATTLSFYSLSLLLLISFSALFLSRPFEFLLSPVQRAHCPRFRIPLFAFFSLGVSPTRPASFLSLFCSWSTWCVSLLLSSFPPFCLPPEKEKGGIQPATLFYTPSSALLRSASFFLDVAVRSLSFATSASALEALQLMEALLPFCIFRFNPACSGS